MSDHLPAEMLLEIFSRLPANAVLKFRRVCKTWQYLLSLDETNEDDLAAMHFRLHTDCHQQHDGIGSSKVISGSQGLIFLIRSKDNINGPDGKMCHRTFYGEFDDDTITIEDKLRLINHHDLQNRWKSTTIPTYLVGSCNGLICFGEAKDSFLICNPITREWMHLQGLTIKIEDLISVDEIYGGFGYIPKTNEYKVVRISYSSLFCAGVIQVCTLGDGSSWRHNGTIITPLPFRSPRAVLFNGGLHWLAGNGKDIFVFDLMDEAFHSLPPVPALDHEKTSVLGSFGEGLCVSGWVSDKCLDIWSFKKTPSKENIAAATDKTDKSWSWCKEFSVITPGNSSVCTPLVVTNSGFFLFKHKEDLDHHLAHKSDPSAETLFCYLEKTWELE